MENWEEEFKKEIESENNSETNFEDKLKNDEISAVEEGFLQGYEDEKTREEE